MILGCAWRLLIRRPGPGSLRESVVLGSWVCVRLPTQKPQPSNLESVPFRSAEALGLKKVGDVTEQPDNACTQGKIKKIIHLIKVEK